MAPRGDWNVFSATCPSRQSLARIANKWTAMIVILLSERAHRFGELHRHIEGISKKVLRDTLRALERDGLVTREATGAHPVYVLTDLGRTLEAPLSALQEWAEAHVEDVLDARDRFDAAADEHVLRAVDAD